MALYLLGLLALQELLFRFVFPLPEVRNYNRIDYVRGELHGVADHYVRDIDLRMRSLPDTQATFHHRLNYYGFRGGRWKLERPPGTQRVLFIGDSFVEGNMALEDETIPRAFQRAARQAGQKVEALNLGVSGGDWISYLRLTRHSLPLWKPEGVILVIFANDLTSRPDFHPDPARRAVFFDRWRPRVLEMLGLLRRREMIPVRFSTRKVWFSWNDPRAPIPPDSVLARTTDPFIAEAIRTRDFNWGLINWPLKVEGFLRQPLRAAGHLATLRDDLASLGVALYVAYLPTKNQVTNAYNSYERKSCRSCPEELDLTGEIYQAQACSLAAQCSRLKIPFLDLTGRIREEEREGRRMYWRYDVHMRGSGYTRVGTWLHRWWSEEERRKAGGLSSTGG